MKRALIAVATVGILAPAAWVTEANAQYGASPPAYSGGPAYGPSQQYAPSRRYARRAYRRSARAPQPSGGNPLFPPGPGSAPYDGSRQGYAAPSPGPRGRARPPRPHQRGQKCITPNGPKPRFGFPAGCKKLGLPSPLHERITGSRD